MKKTFLFTSVALCALTSAALAELRHRRLPQSPPWRRCRRPGPNAPVALTETQMDAIRGGAAPNDAGYGNITAAQAGGQGYFQSPHYYRPSGVLPNYGQFTADVAQQAHQP